MKASTPNPAAGLIADNEVDVFSVLRYVLERRAFDNASIDAVSRIVGPRPVAQFFEATSFMENDSQRLRELVITLLGAAHAIGFEIALWLHGKKDGVRFRYAVISSGAIADAHRGADFQRMLEGSFPGVALRAMRTGIAEDLAHDLLALASRDAAGVLLGIPSEREDTPVETRLDEVLNGLAGREFDVMVHARPAVGADLDIAESNLAHLSGIAHELTRQQLSVSSSDSFSESVAAGISESWSTSETTSWSTSESVSTSRQVKGHHARGLGAAIGTIVGGIVGAAVGAPLGPEAAATAVGGAKVGAVVGGVLGSSVAGNLVPPVTEAKTIATTEGGGTANQRGRSDSLTETKGVARQWGQSVGVERLNRQAGLIGDLAELHLARIRAMKSVGAWHASIHVATHKTTDLALVASLLTGALRGDQSHLETIKLVKALPAAVRPLLERASAFLPEKFKSLPHPLFPQGEQPATLLSSGELAHWFRPPSTPIIGVDVRALVTFGASVPKTLPQSPVVRLGPLIAGGRTVSGVPVEFATTDLLRHCFVAGTTGSGKTTTVHNILRQLAVQNIPFLVIEPAKSEYRELFEELVRWGKHPLRLTLRGGTHSEDRALRFNPWRVPPGALWGRHVEGMKLLLRSCFAMQESLPQILERVVFELYTKMGWEDLASTVPEQPRPFPTFADFVAPPDKLGGRTFLQKIVDDMGYRAEATGNLSAAIAVRLSSFTRGLKGQLFAGEDGQFDEIFKRPTFIELADINEPDIKRFLLGALVQRLATELEVRQRGAAPASVHHALVLEEAHHFLREAAGNGPGAELARESNALLANAFAEMRAFGEAIIIADQAPAELSPAVLRNTNMKIVHRLLYEHDCRAMGDAMGLDDPQQRQLRSLRPGECVVHGPSFSRPVQCRVEREEDV